MIVAKKCLLWTIQILALTFVLSYCGFGTFALYPLCLLLSTSIVFLVFKREGVELKFCKTAVGLGFLLYVSRAILMWAINIFPLDVPEKVIVTLRMPLDGFVLPFVKDFVIKVLIPGLLLSVFLAPFWGRIVGLLNTGIKKALIAVSVLLLNLFTLVTELPLAQYWNFYMRGSFSDVLYHSSLWNEYYKEVRDVTAGDGKSKNLVLIIMESMENWPREFIPELDSLVHAEWPIVSFSDGINTGGFETVGTTTTFSSTVAKITGLPYSSCYALNAIKPVGSSESNLKINQQKAPLGQSKSIYDVLKSRGYKNVFLQGSDANFSDTKTFMISHGIESLYDMNNLKDAWDMNSFFRNFRSFSVAITDSKLYDVSKKILDTLSQTKFSLTLTTIETHFPYGFYDEKCVEKPKSRSEKDLFEATLKCASREVYEYINWLKTRDYYDDTEIVIVGDHLFMGSLMTEGRERRWVNLFVNPKLRPSQKNRKFTSFDIAPSILESLGLLLEDHKMGLGVSLFSSEKTLLEKKGLKKLNSEIEKLGCSLEYILQY